MQTAVQTPLAPELAALEAELLFGVPADEPAPRRLALPRGFAAKHALDRIVAALLLLVLLPVLVAAAAAVLLSSRGPLLHRQRRVGQDGRIFEILKFRSMRPAPDGAAAGFVPQAGRAPGGVEGVDRRTKVGRVLRAFSIDELPQLLNVLRGEMSLVGPRPERPEYDAAFAVEIPGYADRLRARPGLTGLAQVRGLRGQTSITDRAAADNEYIDRWSPLTELAIWVRTPLAVLTPAE
jgi:lipopolysaccharide/colanic/teichoic acid biosynthesis glycosyltransferase